jgi:hypothetical protein
MPLTRRSDDEEQPLVRDSLSSDTSDSHELDDFDVDEAYKHSALSPSARRRSQSLSQILPWRAGRHRKWLGASWKWVRLAKRCTFFLAIFLLLYVILTPLLWPSYLRRPSHYSGTNNKGHKVFIAANIVDEDLIRGDWGRQLVELVELLGENNAYLSIYENDSGPGTKNALQELKERVSCRYW